MIQKKITPIILRPFHIMIGIAATIVAVMASSAAATSEALPYCGSLGIMNDDERAGCTAYCMNNGYADGQVSVPSSTAFCDCMKQQDGSPIPVCQVKSAPSTNLGDNPCSSFGVTNNVTCKEYCSPAWAKMEEVNGTLTKCSCDPFTCFANSSSVLRLLLPSLVVVAASFFVTMGI